MSRRRYRRSHVALATGGPSYPAYIPNRARPNRCGAIPAYFTRRTVNRIARDIADAFARSELTPDDRPFRAWWDGDALVIEGSSPHPKPWRFPQRRDGLYSLFDRGDWVELLPRWRTNRPSARAILRMLSVDTPNGIPLLDRLAERAATEDLTAALREGDDGAREILIGVLMKRDDREAWEAIAARLNDPAPGVRAEAAHAFWHVPATDWAPLLFDVARDEPDSEVREVQIMALAACDYQPAMDWLLKIASDASGDERSRDAAREAAASLQAGR